MSKSLDAYFAAVTHREENLASKGLAIQCSTSNNMTANLAVDGQQNTKSCTGGLSHAWWAVDLKQAFQVGSVTLTNDNEQSQGNWRYTVVVTENGRHGYSFK